MSNFKKLPTTLLLLGLAQFSQAAQAALPQITEPSITNITASGIIKGALGITFLLALAWLFSSNRKAINWKGVGIGLGLQITMAIGILFVPFIDKLFSIFGQLFVSVLDFTAIGSKFLLGNLVDLDKTGYIFAFQILPTIIFFSAITSLLFHLGIIQKVVAFFARIMVRFLKLSGAESLSVIGNIFLGMTEAPLMIKAYLDKMNRSEIFMVMSGGMATIAGGVLAAYVGFLGGNDPELRLQMAKTLTNGLGYGCARSHCFCQNITPSNRKHQNRSSNFRI